MKPITANEEDLEPTALPKRRRRWWLLILFGIAAILVLFAVATLSDGPSKQFKFLTQTTKVTESESILNTIIGTQRFQYNALYISEKNLADLAVEAGKELELNKWTPTTRNSHTAGWRNPAHDANLIMFAEDSRTRVWIIQSRPPTVLDRVRVWLKNRLPFLSPKPKVEIMP